MKITLGKSVQIDLDKLIESRLLVQANSGGGKSWAIRRIVEKSFGKKQIIILDPEGEFGNLRSEFDFVYAGKGGDAPVESRSAALLAHRLLELKASTIVDLYELPPQERKRFVRLFCEAMVNAPKELWHDVLIVIDEAHVFAPEKGESEAMGPVIDLATRGRKRGYCVVLATQRLPKLNKDAAAECNNKLIGRASQDIDRKRAAEELGFSTKDQVLSLRDLAPGEFYVFGPAISRDVIRVTIGDVKVKPAKRGVTKARVAAPSSTVKKILGRLADLPQEAEKEAKTVAELKAEITRIKREANRPVVDLDTIDKAVAAATRELTQKMNQQGAEFMEQHNKLVKIFEQIAKLIQPVLDDGIIVITSARPLPAPRESYMDAKPYKPTPEESKRFQGIQNDSQEATLGRCEKKVFSFLYENPDRSFSKVQLGAVTGYSPTSGGFNNALSRLTTMNLIDRDQAFIRLRQQVFTDEQLNAYLLLGEKFSAAPEFWNSKLGACERKIYQFLWDNPDEIFSKEIVGEMTGYSPTSGGFNNALSRLNSIGLMNRVPNSCVRLNPELRDI
jgi:hypothetical protein